MEKLPKVGWGWSRSGDQGDAGSSGKADGVALTTDLRHQAHYLLQP